MFPRIFRKISAVKMNKRARFFEKQLFFEKRRLKNTGDDIFFFFNSLVFLGLFGKLFWPIPSQDITKNFRFLTQLGVFFRIFLKTQSLEKVNKISILRRVMFSRAFWGNF